MTPTSIWSPTGNPTYDSVARSIVIAMSSGITVWIVTWLAAHKVVDPNLNLLIGTAVFTTLTTLAGAAWGLIVSSQVQHVIAVKETAAVQAGINMTVQGAALASDGVTPVSVNNGTTPPLPVTPETAKQIIKDFGPSEHTITEALNAAQLKGKTP